MDDVNKIVQEANGVYYHCKASPGQTIHPIVLVDGQWVLGPVTIVCNIRINHSSINGVDILYTCKDNSEYMESLDRQDIVHREQISARHACFHKNRRMNESVTTEGHSS